ncbi:cell wall-active antibiotics response protein LiaF [Paenibacillus thalictri]|uniref:Cell wall-active antibiotics response protein n=1 Tax=Paenibacillus thalictri TaxID=2527873 RepID=A0A4V2J361_9BACL|nr:cell wall-active antibiotics response protein LiaF [Paenibacillus thalictri]TBL70052.1 hypothetical protein EYB31_34130 [Paenibacillus thalictri]
MNPPFLRKLLFGFGLIGVGVLFLLSQNGIIQLSIGSVISIFWPVLLICFGLSGLFRRHKHRGWPGAYLWSVIVTGVGTVLLLNNLNITDISFHDVFQYMLPLLLIVFGIGLLFSPPREERKKERHEWRERRKEEKRRWKEAMKNGYASSAEYYKEAHDYIHTEWKRNKEERNSFIGDIFLGQDYWELTPTNIAHFIGDTVIDLTKASIPFGETLITVSAFVGDVKLLVPNDYDVEVRVEASAFIGDMNVLDRRESGMMRHIATQSPHYADAGKKVRLVVNMFIGDVVVKRVG